MKYSIARHLKGRPKVYRFAVYGGTEAGKTCLLTILGMAARVANPAGFTCQRQRHLEGCPRPPGGSATWDLEKDPVAAFYAGDEKMEDARNCIAGGNRPPATDKQPPYLLLYSFSSKLKGSFLVEMIDYSGELTRSEHLNTDQKARLLERHLESMDAIFILMEAPRPGEENRVIPESLSELMASFDRIQSKKKEGSRWNIPVSILVNKWDRRSAPGDTAKQRHEALEALMNRTPEPYHVGIRTKVRNTVGEDNVRTFVVSAFGEAQVEDGTREFPVRQEQLHSYGLEDPFVWAARRRDDIDLKAYREAVADCPRWRRWLNGLRPDIPFRWMAMAGGLQRQLPVGTPEQVEARKGRFSNGVMGLSRSLIGAALSFVLLALGQTFLDRPGYTRAVADLESPESTPELQKSAQKWLADYAASPPFWHALSHYLVLAKPRAASLLQDWQAQREEKLWKRVVEKAPDRIDQLPAARDYLAAYPDNGARSREAEDLVADGEEQHLWIPVTEAEGPERIRLAQKYLLERPKGRYVKPAEAMLIRGEVEEKLSKNETLLSQMEGG